MQCDASIGNRALQPGLALQDMFVLLDAAFYRLDPDSLPAMIGSSALLGVAEPDIQWCEQQGCPDSITETEWHQEIQSQLESLCRISKQRHQGGPILCPDGDFIYAPSDQDWTRYGEGEDQWANTRVLTYIECGLAGEFMSDDQPCEWISWGRFRSFLQCGRHYE